MLCTRRHPFISNFLDNFDKIIIKILVISFERLYLKGNYYADI
jgi:hypothetical protein